MNDINIITKIFRELDLNDIKESDEGKIYSISGPVVVGKNMSGCAMYELVKVG